MSQDFVLQSVNGQKHLVEIPASTVQANPVPVTVAKMQAGPNAPEEAGGSEETGISGSFRKVKRKRNRPTVSCLICKRKKIKCDRMKPMCGACLRNRVPDGSCVYMAHVPCKSSSEGPSFKVSSSEDESICGRPMARDRNPGGTVKRLYCGEQESPTKIRGYVPTGACDGAAVPGGTQHPGGPLGQAQIGGAAGAGGAGAGAGVGAGVGVEAANLQAGTTGAIAKARVKTGAGSCNAKARGVSGASNGGASGDESCTIDETPRMESLLNEIDRLKRQIQGGTGWEMQALTKDIWSTDVPILKGVRKAHLRRLTNMADRNLRICNPGTVVFAGPSSFRSFIDLDVNLGPLARMFYEAIHVESSQWLKVAPSELHHKRVEKIIDSQDCRVIRADGLTDEQRTVIRLVEEYLIDYNTFLTVFNDSYATIQGILPVVPLPILNTVLQRRFQRGADGHSLHIVVEGKDPTEFAEITMILALLKFGHSSMPPTLAIPPAHITHPENTIYGEFSSNLLYFFCTTLINYAEYRTRSNVPLLLALIALYFVALRSTERYEFATFENLPLFQSTTVQMAVSLGFHRDISRPLNVFNMSNTQEDLCSMFSPDDWRTVWNIVMYLDTMGSFVQGVPSMVGASVDQCFTSGAFAGLARDVIGAYRAVLRLITSSATNEPVSLFQLEKLITAVDNINRNKMKPFGELIRDITSTNDTGVISQELLGMLLKLRTCSLLIFLYTHAYRVFQDSNAELIRMGRLFGRSLEEAKMLEKRYFDRSFRCAVFMLGLLNRLLLSNYSNRVTQLGIFSTDLSSLFIRCIYVLCSVVLDGIQQGNFKDKEVLRIDDFDIETLDLVNDSSKSDDPRFQQTVARVDEFLTCPVSILRYLNGFFFNSSRSSISKDYNFFSCYKYMFLVLNYMAEKHLTLETLDRKDFLERFKNVDSTWFGH